MYLPIHCASCATIALRVAHECLGGEATCPRCGEIAQVVPGCSYVEGDVPLFNRLKRLVEDSGLSSEDARRLAFEIEGGVESRAFDILAKRLPALQPELFSPGERRTALSILDTLLTSASDLRASPPTSLQAPRAGDGAGP